MTFRNYILTIQRYIGAKSQPKTIIELFKAAGNTVEIPEETAKSWIKEGEGHRDCYIPLYFPDQKLNEAGFIHFFESRITSDWKKFQASFASINDDQIIDLHTDIANDFYWSLLKQFQKIFNLPLSAKPTMTNNISIRKEMLDIFTRSAEFNHITDLISRDPAFLELRLPNMNYNLLQTTPLFIEEIDYNILTLFASYSTEMVYIKIAQFIFLLKKYFQHISTPFHRELYLNRDTKDNPENDTMHFQAQLQSIYNEIIHMYQCI